VQHVLKLLADPTRVRILLTLEGEELAVNEIAEVLGMSQSRVSNHLRLMRDADALTARREGAWTFYRNRLSDTPVWHAVREGMRSDPACKADRSRRQTVLDKRRSRSREHFAAGRGNGVALESGSLRAEILAALAPPEWVVVDAGCGDGFLTEALSERFRKVLAFDHSPERLATARERLPAPHVRFQEGEVDALPLRSSSTDALFFSMVLHHVPEIGAALDEAHRVLRPGGRIVVADLAPHDEEKMRETMGDLRLGLDATALQGVMREAGFEEVRLLPVSDRLLVGRNRYLDLILAAGRKPAKKKTIKRRIK
jgi:ArsR family transcriptional regulator